jgi:hypothetical protein
MLKIAKPVEVELEGLELAGESYDFWFMVKCPKFSLFDSIRKEKPDDSELPDFVTVEILSNHIVEWKSEAFEDADTDVMLPCTPENVAQVIEDTPAMYGVFQRALMQAHVETVRKNSATSPDGTSTGEEDSVKGAKQTSG